MIDIHCHILPEIDDGSRSRGMSFKMCQMAVASGVSDIIATPHMLDLYAGDDFREKVEVRLQYLNALMKERGIDLTIHSGAEVYASSDIAFAPDLSEYALAGSRYLLVEFDFDATSLDYAKEVVSIIQSQDLIPVIAHPERYRFTQSHYDNINRLSDCGALFQCNLGSLTGELGRKSAKLAGEMLKAGAISFLASDAHRVDYRNTDFKGYLSVIKEMYNGVDITPLVQDNPAKLLRGERVEHPSFAILKKKLF